MSADQTLHQQSDALDALTARLDSDADLAPEEIARIAQSVLDASDAITGALREALSA